MNQQPHPEFEESLRRVLSGVADGSVSVEDALDEVCTSHAWDRAQTAGRFAAQLAVETLAPRELQVLKLAVSGLTVKEAASRMGISGKTVCELRRRARKRLGSSTTSAATAVVGMVMHPYKTGEKA